VAAGPAKRECNLQSFRSRSRRRICCDKRECSSRDTPFADEFQRGIPVRSISGSWKPDPDIRPIAYPHSFRSRRDVPSYGSRRRTGVLQVPRLGAFRQVLGDAALLAARQSRRLANDASDDALGAVLTALRRFHRLDRRTCT